MSGFSSLFGNSNKNYDESLNKIFSTKTDGPISTDQLISKKRTIINVPESSVKSKKRKQSADKEEEVNEIVKDDEEEEEEDSSEDDSDEADDSEDEDEEIVEDEEIIEPKITTKKSKKRDENYDLEARYFEKNFKNDEEPTIPKEQEEKDVEDSEDNLAKETKPSKAQSASTIDFKESEMEKAERTVFVGNVPSDVVTSKTKTKEFKKLFKKYGKIESIRFRSISFEENLPRKISFAKKNLHKSRDSVNAYIVFSEKSSSLLVCKKLNGKIFENHHLRVDHIAHPSPKDNKRTIFVGNLDFEEQEENLWKYFNSKLENDVESVRIIRDSKTNMGKGFALVQFKDSLSVNKALMLNEKPMDIVSGNKKGRKLRISRAKSNAKPSLLSPNHYENLKKTYASNKSKDQANKLTDSQKTKIGRAQNILGKADRSSIGKKSRTTNSNNQQRNKFIVEGQRATKGSKIVGIKGLKNSGKVKKPRIRDRSTKFRNERASMENELKK
ncbi:NOP12 [Candida jiufengensis]|uniref:NOP12 n=1 Tax=Candida jiufengensis TaxID=497108 RepID=UPI0022249B90|nr:NOP12 [Candida jiufengensis]KAI5951909.1 NOP12 [Candida jiufengensis]